MELFTPAWNSKYPEKRMNAVRKITGIDKLQRIAEKTKHEDVQQVALKFIALWAKDWGVRQVALNKITDQAVLRELALKNPGWVPEREACEASVRRITDQAILKDVALKASLKSVRSEAMKKIKDRAILKEVALNASDADVCKAAWEMITDPDQSFLREAAFKASAQLVRCAAVTRITDEAVLIEIALKSADKDVLLVAVKKITDQAVLKEVALINPHHWVRHEAVKKITDHIFLREVALKDSAEYIRAEAVMKITDPQILEQLAFEAPETHVRLASFARLPYSNDKLMQNLRGVLEGQHEGSNKRKKAANELMEMLKLNPKAAGMFWDKVRRQALVPHEDSSSHCDTSGRSSDCNTDLTTHTDTGIGINFPPCPFKD